MTAKELVWLAFLSRNPSKTSRSPSRHSTPPLSQWLGLAVQLVGAHHHGRAPNGHIAQCRGAPLWSPTREPQYVSLISRRRDEQDAIVRSSNCGIACHNSS